MNTFIKLATVLLCLNIFMYLGVNFAINVEGHSLNEKYNFRFQNDLISTFMENYDTVDTQMENFKTNWTSYGLNYNGNYTKLPTQESGTVSGTGGVNFIDTVKLVWYFIPTLCNIMIAPLTLFFNFRMPILVGFMIGIPYFFVLVLTFIAFLRGVSD